MQPLFFVHIPKTAGTSFREAALRAWGESAVLNDYGDSVHTSDAVARLLHHQQDHAAFANYMAAHRIRMFCGHTPARRYAALFEPERIITFVRDPVARVVSHYHTAVRYQNYAESLETFCHQDDFINLQSIYLRDQKLDSLGFVGITENYTESLFWLNQQHRWLLKPLTRNLHRTGRSAADYRADIPAALYEEIKRLNASDQAIYEEACALFKVRSRNLPDLPAANDQFGFSSVVKKLVRRAV